MRWTTLPCPHSFFAKLHDPKYRTLSPQKANLAPIACVHMLQESCTEQSLEGMWLSLLAMPGTIIRYPTPGMVGIVLSVSQYGVLLWKAPLKKVGATFFITPSRAPEPWFYANLFDTETWSVLVVEAWPPGRVHAALASASDSSARCGMALVRTGPKTSLMTHAAECGFPNLTVPFLAKLWRYLDIPNPEGGRPKTEKGLAEGLVKACLPNVTGDELEHIVALRCKGMAPVVDTILVDPENAELVKDAFDGPKVEKLKAEMAKEAVRAAEARTRRKATPRSRGTGSASSSSGAPPAPLAAGSSSLEAVVAELPPAAGQETEKPRLPAPGGKARFTVADVSPLLPRVAGCGATIEHKWRSRWRARYPGGFSTSKSFGGEVTEYAAVEFIARAAWAEHMRLNPHVECPWSFSV